MKELGCYRLTRVVSGNIRRDYMTGVRKGGELSMRTRIKAKRLC